MEKVVKWMRKKLSLFLSIFHSLSLSLSQKNFFLSLEKLIFSENFLPEKFKLFYEWNSKPFFFRVGTWDLFDAPHFFSDKNSFFFSTFIQLPFQYNFLFNLIFSLMIFLVVNIYLNFKTSSFYNTFVYMKYSWDFCVINIVCLIKIFIKELDYEIKEI